MRMVLAHRGFSSQYPENTMLAFEKAIEAGADGVEFDVQLTKDGVPVIVHDESLTRLAGVDAYVHQLTYGELEQLDVTHRFSGKVPVQRIPKLETYFELVKDRTFLSNIELKTAYLEYPGIEQKVIDMIRAYGLSERVVLSSFNHYSLLRVKQIAPELPCGVLYECRIAEPQDYAKRLGMQYLHPMRLFLDDAELEKYARAGVPASPWTVDEPDDLRYFLAHPGIFAVITNRPDEALRIRAQLS